MKRRRFLSAMVIILPAAFVSTDVLLSSCNPDVEKEEFSEENIRLLDDIGETIIPSTAGSPGAKEAGIGKFMKVYVSDCYTDDQKTIFWSGIQKIKNISWKKYRNEFSQLSVGQRQAVLRSLENESVKPKNNAKKEGTGDAIQTGKDAESKETVNTSRFFPMIQSLTVFGYFTSEPGATKALRYIQTPGTYKGEVTYKEGDKCWAT